MGRTSTTRLKERDPLVLGRIGIGAGESEYVIGQVAGGCPDLLPVQHPLVTVELRAQSEASEIAAGIRLAVALTPDVVVGENARQVVPLLLLGAPLKESVPEHGDAEAVVRPSSWHPGNGELLGQNHLFESREAATAVLGRPTGREIALAVQDAAPVHDPLVRLIGREVRDAPPVSRQIGREECLHTASVVVNLGCVGGAHTANLLA